MEPFGTTALAAFWLQFEPQVGPKALPKCTRKTQNEPKGYLEKQSDPRRHPKGAKSELKADRREPEGSQGEPKGSQR